MKLTKEQLIELISYIDEATLIDDSDREIQKHKQSDLYYSKRHIPGEHDYWHYKRIKNNLTDFIGSLTNRNVEDMTALHRIKYYIGDGNKPHTDQSDYTIVIILNSDCKGGQLILNNIPQLDFNQTGDYIMYNGGLERHSVTPITEGTREVLVAWYKNSNRNKSLL